MDLRARRELNQGFGDALSRAFELAVTPVVFGFVGHLLDTRMDTSPIFMLAFAAFAVVGSFVKFWYAYDGEMKAKADSSVWGRPNGTAPGTGNRIDAMAAAQSAQSAHAAVPAQQTEDAR